MKFPIIRKVVAQSNTKKNFFANLAIASFIIALALSVAALTVNWQVLILRLLNPLGKLFNFSIYNLTILPHEYAWNLVMFFAFLFFASSTIYLMKSDKLPRTLPDILGPLDLYSKFQSHRIHQQVLKSVEEKTLKIGVELPNQRGYKLPGINVKAKFSKEHQLESAYIDLEKMGQVEELKKQYFPENLSSSFSGRPFNNLNVTIVEDSLSSKWIRFWIENTVDSRKITIDSKQKLVLENNYQIPLMQNYFHNFHENNSLAIVGRTRSGKTMLVYYLVSILSSKLPAQNIFIATDKQDYLYSLSKLLPTGNYLDLFNGKFDGEVLFQMSQRLVGLMKKRQEFIYENTSEPGSDYLSVGLKDIYFFVDEIGNYSFPSNRKLDDKRTIKQAFNDNLKIIAKQGRSAGVHLILITQFASSEAFDTDIRAQLTGRILLGNSTGGERQFLFPTEEIPDRAYGISKGIATFDGVKNWQHPKYFEAPLIDHSIDLYKCVKNNFEKSADRDSSAGSGQQISPSLVQSHKKGEKKGDSDER
ncbi:hypothetical protein [Oenococcus oeni]|uniref:hypothetical protein n=1 Tax=Oenococcus oeni TaxID=1247 RepID=UPI00050F4BF3|nr:hypothetical protein [Oenococcus oeni]KGH87576.1 hypothetical protein X350_08285 [Oenococcus oeni S12]